MKNLFKDKKGITLIALIITIVVLIILAGVLINISLGNNGLFNKAKTAKEMYTNAQDYEETEIVKMTNNMDSYVDGNRGTVTLTEEEYAIFKNMIKRSTNEKIVGYWIDGKPLYQRTFTSNSMTNDTWNTIGTIDNIATAEIRNINGAIYSSDGLWFGITDTITNDFHVALLIDPTGNIKVSPKRTTNSWSKISVTVEYTKTTDTAAN